MKTLTILVSMVLVLAAAGGATADTLVLPFHTTGVDATTAEVCRNLLQQELQAKGVAVMTGGALAEGLPTGEQACVEPGCAGGLARRLGADRVVYGSLSRLGEKILVQVYALPAGAVVPNYSDRFSVFQTEDLDRVMLRIAEGLARGRANSDQATVDSVTRTESEEPLRRATRRGLGFRGGFIYPTGDSYGGTNRLTSLTLLYKYEGRDFFVESTVLTGLAWGENAVEWTPLDVFAARFLSREDAAPYFGAGLGIRSLHLERSVGRNVEPLNQNDYWSYQSQNETTLSLDVGVGLIALRTFDFNLVLDLRYHYVLDSFDDVGGDGAHGVVLRFGTGY